MLLDQTVVETLQETRGITAMVEQTQFGIQGLGGGINMIQTSQTQIEQRSIVRDELIMGSLEALADRTQENNLVLRNEIRILQTLLYNILGEAGRLTTAEKTDQSEKQTLQLEGNLANHTFSRLAATCLPSDGFNFSIHDLC
jgi:hypothetical protein